LRGLAAGRRRRPIGLSGGLRRRPGGLRWPLTRGPGRRRPVLIPSRIMRLLRRHLGDPRPGFGLWLRFLCGGGSLGRGFWAVVGERRSLRRRLIALHQIGWDALLRARHALRKERFALAGNLLLGIEDVGRDHFGRIELAARRAGSQHQHERQRRAGPHQRRRKSPRRHLLNPCRPPRSTGSTPRRDCARPQASADRR
jgi:hypothetical protein